MPCELFALFSAAQLDELVCGPRLICVVELRHLASYEGVGASEPHVLLLWDALATFDARELAQFVEFCSGSARAPRKDAPRSTRSLKLTPPPPGADANPDQYLPLSQTCFFSLALPRYTTLQACCTKLRYAIKNAHLMDADFLLRHADGWADLQV